jgi:hypothetical protein
MVGNKVSIRKFSLVIPIMYIKQSKLSKKIVKSAKT